MENVTSVEYTSELRKKNFCVMVNIYFGIHSILLKLIFLWVYDIKLPII